MRYAIISDVHGNYTALQAVLEDAAAMNAEQYILLGDYIFDLPFSNEVVHEIMRIQGAWIIAGNKEGYLRQMTAQDPKTWIYEQIGVLYQTVRELEPEVMSFLLGLEETRSIPLACGKTAFAVHYLPEVVALDRTRNRVPSSFHEKMRRSPFTRAQFLADYQRDLETEAYQRALEPIHADVILFGHSHLQYYGTCAGKLVLNPGSCGQPLDFDTRAAYTLLDSGADGFHVTERKIAYAIDAVIESAKKTQTYQCGRIWSELVFRALKSDPTVFIRFFSLAHALAKAKNENGPLFENATLREAWEQLSRTD